MDRYTSNFHGFELLADSVLSDIPEQQWQPCEGVLSDI